MGSSGCGTARSACDHAASQPSCGRPIRTSTGGQLKISLFSGRHRPRPPTGAASPSRTSRSNSPVSTASITAAAVIEAVETGEFDLLVLDGEAAPVGGLGLCRQLKSEIFSCPPVLVLTGRPQDGWLAAWSQADLAVPHPLDPIAVAGAVAELGRTVGASTTSGETMTAQTSGGAMTWP